MFMVSCACQKAGAVCFNPALELTAKPFVSMTPISIFTACPPPYSYDVYLSLICLSYRKRRAVEISSALLLPNIHAQAFGLDPSLKPLALVFCGHGYDFRDH